MTKLVELRVQLAVDDLLTQEDLKPALKDLIAAHGTQELNSGYRAHWGSIDVLQGQGTGEVRKKKKRAPPLSAVE